MSYSTHIGKFISENKDWKEILSNEPYNLKISCDGEYVLLKYDMRTADFSSPIVKEARGIIFKVGEWEYPVCHPFNKFFNYGEIFSDDVDWNSSVVSEKIDGSLMKLWFDENKWHLSTNGSIDAYKTDLLYGTAQFSHPQRYHRISQSTGHPGPQGRQLHRSHQLRFQRPRR